MNLEELLIELASVFSKDTMYYPIKINGTHNWEYLNRKCVRIENSEIIIETTDSPNKEDK